MQPVRTPQRRYSSTSKLPTIVLPRLSRRLTPLSASTLLSHLSHLRSLYSHPSVNSITAESNQNHLHQPQDSGYSSEQEDENDEEGEEGGCSDQESHLGKDDMFERTFAKEWALRIVKRGEDWVADLEEKSEDYGEDLTKERDLRLKVMDEAAALVASLTETSASGSIMRPLSFPTSPVVSYPASSSSSASSSTQEEDLVITLHDALPSSVDPTSVGLQSWGSSILLGRMMALDPNRFGIGLVGNERVLELGAGTGLLSLVWKGMAERRARSSIDHKPVEVVATDFHRDVLENLKKNVKNNRCRGFDRDDEGEDDKGVCQEELKALNISPANGESTSIQAKSNLRESKPFISVHKLDWEAVHSSSRFNSFHNSNFHPVAMPPPFHQTFKTIFAADVVYNTDHAGWLKSCVEQFLRKPEETMFASSLEAGTVPPLLSLSKEVSEVVTMAEDENASLSASNPASGKARLAQVEVEPTFYLIVPLRPTHSLATDSIAESFPMASDYSPSIVPSDRVNGRKMNLRLAVKKLTKIERVRGVGRADEGSYRLYEIGWC